MAVAAISTVGAIGAGLGFWGELQASGADYQTALAYANEKENLARELESRQRVEEDIIRRQAKGVQAEQEVAFGAAGLDISGATLDILLETNRRANEEIALRQRETSYEVASLHRAARQTREYGKAIKGAREIGAYGSLIGSASRVGASAYSGATTAYGPVGGSQNRQIPKQGK